MSTGIIMNFHFMHNQGGRLQIHRVIGHVLCLLLCSPNGLMPSALKPNHTFLASSAKSFHFLSIFLHYDPSAGTLNFPSFLRSSLCHRINLACSLFWNKRFNRGIIGAYHITLAGTLFLGRSPSTSPGSSHLILYHNAPHIGHAFKSSYSPRQRMQLLGHACIFCTSNPRGHRTFFASYVLPVHLRALYSSHY